MASNTFIDSPSKFTGHNSNLETKPYHIIYIIVVQAKFQPITMLSNQQKHCEQFAKPYITISPIMSVARQEDEEVKTVPCPEMERGNTIPCPDLQHPRQ